jgi:peptidylprolyl isomerase
MLPLIASLVLGASFANAADPAPAPSAAEATVTTKSGLQYVDVKVGTGATPKKGQTVALNYTITVNGKKIEGSTPTQPMQFEIGKEQALKALEEGVSTMKVGGQRKLIVPPELGYGAEGIPGRVPPNSVLNFDVELLSVH